MFGRIWSLYTSTTSAPFSGTLEDGFRFRIGVGYGRYAYDALVRIGPQHFATRAHVQTGYGEGLVGWRWSLGSTTLSAFGGLMADGTLTETDHPWAWERVLRYSVKGALESWTWLDQTTYLQADGQWRGQYGGGSGRVRLGVVVSDGLSIGVEGMLLANSDLTQGRVGGFGRAAFAWGEVSVSGGIGGEPAPLASPYATVSFLRRF